MTTDNLPSSENANKAKATRKRAAPEAVLTLRASNADLRARLAQAALENATLKSQLSSQVKELEKQAKAQAKKDQFTIRDLREQLSHYKLTPGEQSQFDAHTLAMAKRRKEETRERRAMLRRLRAKETAANPFG